MTRFFRSSALMRRSAVRISGAALTALITTNAMASTPSLAWDSGGATPTNPTDGIGTWDDTTHADWSNGTTDTAWADGDIAVFGQADGTAGTVTLGDSVTAAGLTFNAAGSGNYNIAGTSFLTLTGIATIIINGAQPTISAPIAGSFGLLMEGSSGGTLTLTGNNTYTGITRVASGTLILGSNAALSGNTLTVGSAGTLNINAPNASAFNVSNSGSFIIAAGDALTLGYGSTFNQSAGTLAVNGAFAMTTGNFNYAGGSIAGTPIVLGGYSELTLGSGVSTGTFNFTSNTSSQYLNLTSNSIPAGVTINEQPVSGTAGSLNSYYVNNSGTLSIIAPVGGTTGFNNSSYSVNNSGTINISALGAVSSVPTFNTSSLTNTGRFNVNTSANFSGGTINNSGNFNIASGATIGFTNNGLIFNQSGGTLAVNGTFTISAGTFDYTGGTITGTPIILAGSSSLSLGPGASSGSFNFTGNTSSQYLSVAPGYAIPAKVTINEQPAGGGGTLNSSSNVNNNGTLSIIAPVGGTAGYNDLGHNFNNSGTVNISAMGAVSSVPTFISTLLTNTANFNVNTSANFIGGVINNSGNFTIASGATISWNSGGAWFNQLGGTLAVNGSFVMTGQSSFLYTGGTITGTPIVLGGSSTLNLGSGVSTGTFNLTTFTDPPFIYVNLYLTSPAYAIPAGVAINVEPPSGTNGNLGVSSNVTNNGVVSIIAPVGGSAGFNSSNANSNFSNSGTVNISALGAVASYPAFNTDLLTNSGSFNINTNANLNIAAIYNNGNFNIANGSTIEFSNTEMLFNQSGGTLAVNGTFVMTGECYFHYTGGTITGTPIVLSGYSALNLGSGVSTGTFNFTSNSSPQYLYLTSPAYAIPAGITINEQPVSGSSTLNAVSNVNNRGVLSITAPVGGTASFNNSDYSYTYSFNNSGTVSISALGAVSSVPTFNTSSLTNTGNFNINTSANFSGGTISNSGNFNIASGATIGFTNNSLMFNQSGGVVNVSAAATLSLPNVGELQVSGGAINLASGSTPAMLAIASLLWPNPATAANPATDFASINTLPVLAGQNPGMIGLNGGERTFNIADPNATLTITADIANGSIDKSGPGTLILNGKQAFTGVLQDLAGTLTIGANASLAVTSITVSSGATLNIIGSVGSIPVTNNGTVNFPATSAGIHAVSLSSLSLSTGQKSTLTAPSAPSNRTFLILGSLSFAGTTNNWKGQLDLTGNDLDVQSASLANITNQVKTGFNGGAWNGQGIISSTAAADTSHLTTLGVIVNNDGSGNAIYGTGTTLGTFDGQSPGLNDVLVKFTYFGDSNLDGAVDGSDYTNIDDGFAMDKIRPGLLTGWYNGDFNYDGKIDGSDYTMIDNAFNTQGASLGSNPLALIATEISQIAGAAVPEPATITMLGFTAIALLSRRRVVPGTAPV